MQQQACENAGWSDHPGPRNTSRPYTFGSFSLTLSPLTRKQPFDQVQPPHHPKHQSSNFITIVLPKHQSSNFIIVTFITIINRITLLSLGGRFVNSSSFCQQRNELPSFVQSSSIIAAANVLSTNKHIWHSSLPSPLSKCCLYLTSITFSVKFIGLVRGTDLIEQFLNADAERTVRLAEDDDGIGWNELFRLCCRYCWW